MTKGAVPCVTAESQYKDYETGVDDPMERQLHTAYVIVP